MTPANKPSLRATLLLALVLSITIWNLLRVWTALAWRGALVEFAGAQISEVLIISGAGWSLAGIFLAWGIWLRKNWARKIFIPAAVLYSLWYWFERILLQNPRANWSFTLSVNAIMLLFVIFAIKSLSREAYERKIKNPKIE